LSTPRRACQRMNDSAARRNGRCRGARPVGPRNTRAINARRAAGSSRTAATCAPAKASAPAWWLIASSDTDSPKTSATSARDDGGGRRAESGRRPLPHCGRAGARRFRWRRSSSLALTTAVFEQMPASMAPVSRTCAAAPPPPSYQRPQAEAVVSQPAAAPLEATLVSAGGALGCTDVPATSG
jgi:hypothetical protein